MNSTLREFARRSILDGLGRLPPDNHAMFKLMYGRNGGKRGVEAAKAMALEAVVREIPDDKLDWAMTQVENSLKGSVMLSREMRPVSCTGLQGGSASSLE